MLEALKHNLDVELERVLSAGAAGGTATHIVSLDRRLNPFATLAPNEILTVKLANGRRLRLFLKHVADHEADHPNKCRRDREILVYERSFASQQTPAVPHCYGSSWNDDARTGWLLLEYVDDWCLKYHELQYWFEAARQLARFQRDRAKELATLWQNEFLLRLDGDYFASWFDRARQSCAEQAPPLADALAPVVERVADVADLLGQYAQTLVHNDLAPKNVIADRSASPLRIYLVDWEMAGVGCGVLDIVQLKDGLEPAADQLMVEAYCRELAGSGLLPDEPSELDRLFAACDLHKVVYRLARSRPWRLPIETLNSWVAQAVALCDRVSRSR
jgi:hypothetical protein